MYRNGTSGIRPKIAHASFPPPPQVWPVGGQIDPHQDNSDGVQKADQNLQEFLHRLNLLG
jgi:hypothetical protein